MLVGMVAQMPLRRRSRFMLAIVRDRCVSPLQRKYAQYENRDEAAHQCDSITAMDGRRSHHFRACDFAGIGGRVPRWLGEYMQHSAGARWLSLRAHAAEVLQMRLKFL